MTGLIIHRILSGAYCHHSYEEIAEVAVFWLDGVIATNMLKRAASVGSPFRQKSTEVIKLLAGELSGKLPILGVSDIMDAQTAADKIKAGASLVQIYSGFIYNGPELIREAAEAVYSAES